MIHRYGQKAKLGDRNFINAVVYVLETGTPWRDLPERFGNWKSVYNRFSNWSKANRVLVFKALQLEPDDTSKPHRRDDRPGPPGRLRRKRGLEFNDLGR